MLAEPESDSASSKHSQLCEPPAVMAPDSKQRAEHPARTAMDQLQEVTSSAGQAIDDSLHTAARTLSSGTASANRAYGRAQNRAEVSLVCRLDFRLTSLCAALTSGLQHRGSWTQPSRTPRRQRRPSLRRSRTASRSPRRTGRPPTLLWGRLWSSSRQAGLDFMRLARPNLLFKSAACRLAGRPLQTNAWALAQPGGATLPCCLLPSSLPMPDLSACRSPCSEPLSARPRMWPTGYCTRLGSLASWTSAWTPHWRSGRPGSRKREPQRARCRAWRPRCAVFEVSTQCCASGSDRWQWLRADRQDGEAGLGGDPQPAIPARAGSAQAAARGGAAL